MAGLFVAAVYGAVLSSVSSQASAFAALVWEDFLADWSWFKKSVPISPTNVTRILSAFAGFLGIGIAFLVGGLGTLFQVAYSISGAFIGPLDGLFVTAIAAPWVNKKGALCGFLTSLTLNIWLITGQFIYKVQVDPLPLSTDGCSEMPFNETSVFSSQFLNTTTMLPTATTFQEIADTTFQENADIHVQIPTVKERDHLAIYDISYCYLGTIGILMVFIVSSLVSLITGPNNPYDVDERLVHKPSLKAYRWLWNRFNRRKKLMIVSSKLNGFVGDTATSGITNSSMELEPPIVHSKRH